MAKKITNVVKLQVPAGTMAPTPTLGSILGPTGINMMEFFKQFNGKLKDIAEDTPIPVVLTIYVDRTFSFVTKKPPVSFYLKKATQIQKGSQTPGRSYISQITNAQIKEIAEEKMSDLNANDIEAAMTMILGSARSMGLKVVN